MRILVVDDEFVALTKISTLLSQYGECDAATSGKQASELFFKAIDAGNPYHLVTIDINMPEGNGFELMKTLSRLEERRGITPAKKIIISASSDTRSVLLAARKKCDGFLVKPVKRDALENKLRELELLAVELQT